MRAFVLFVGLLIGLVAGSFIVGMDGPRPVALPGTEMTCPSPYPAGQPALGGCPAGPAP